MCSLTPKHWNIQHFIVTQTPLMLCVSQTHPCDNKVLVSKWHRTYLQRESFPANEGLGGQHCLQNIRGHSHFTLRSRAAETKTEALSHLSLVL